MTKLLLIIFIIISAILFIPTFSHQQEVQSGKFIKNFKYNFTLGFALNDTDLGWNPLLTRGTPLFQKNNHNYDLDGQQIKIDDYIYNQTYASGFFESHLQLSLIYDILIDLKLNSAFTEEFTFKQIEVEELNISTITLGGGVLLANIGDIHPYFSDYTLDLRKKFKAKNKIYWIHNLDYGKSDTRGVVLNLPVGKFLKDKMNLDIGDASITGVLGRPETANQNSEYPNGGQYDKVYYLTGNPPNLDVSILLNPKPGVKEVKEEISANSVNPYSNISSAYNYYVTIRILDGNDQNLNTMPYAPLVSMGKVSDILLKKYVNMQDDRVIISKKLFQDYRSVFGRATKVVVDWGQDASQSRQTLYLNAVRFSYSLPQLPYLTLGLSYVNLHNDKNSTVYKDEVLNPILIDIASADLDFNYKNKCSMHVEYNRSRFSDNENIKPHYYYKDHMGYFEGKYSIKFNKKDDWTFLANTRYIGPEYALGIADLRFVRYLIDDSDNNGKFDYEDNHYQIGEYGYGGGSRFTLNNLFNVGIFFDYQHDLKSSVIYDRPNDADSITYPKGGLDNYEIFNYIFDTSFYFFNIIKLRGYYNLKKHRNGYTKQWSEGISELTLFPSNQYYSIVLSYKQPVKDTRLKLDNLDNYERVYLGRVITKEWECIPIILDETPIAITSDGYVKHVYDKDWRYSSERMFETPITETISGSNNYIELNHQTTWEYGGSIRLSTYLSRLKPSIGGGVSYFKGKDGPTSQNLSYLSWYYEISGEYVIKDFLSIVVSYLEKEIRFEEKPLWDAYGYKYKYIIGMMKIMF